MNIKWLLSLSTAERMQVSNPMKESHVQTDALMKRLIPKDQFVDVSFLLCGAGTTCRIFNDQGELLSHDAAHLTEAGARKLGQQLEQLAVPASRILQPRNSPTPRP